MLRELGGVHHVSALSARISQSRDFYVRILGLRPLITTVNQDSPDMYHLFFGDGAGSPGSDTATSLFRLAGGWYGEYEPIDQDSSPK